MYDEVFKKKKIQFPYICTRKFNYDYMFFPNSDNANWRILNCHPGVMRITLVRGDSCL